MLWLQFFRVFICCSVAERAAVEAIIECSRNDAVLAVAVLAAAAAVLAAVKKQKLFEVSNHIPFYLLLGKIFFWPLLEKEFQGKTKADFFSRLSVSLHFCCMKILRLSRNINKR